MKNIILDIQHISKSFYNKTSGKNFVLKDFNLEIEANKITALIGGNGTGKTTLFNIISRFISADEHKNSKILFNGENLLDLHAHQLAGKGIGRLFQDTRIFPGLSILENMCVADINRFGEKPFESLVFFKKNQMIEANRIKKALQILTELFGEESLFVANPSMLAGNLSYGQQRLLGLARLLMGNYKLLLLDEPTAGVHPKLNEKIAEIILLLKEQEKTVFLIEHNMSFVRKTADRVAFINEHKIFIQGTPAEVLNNKKVQKYYLGII